MKMHNIAAIIVAAGRGERAGQSHEGPKQFRRIGDRAVIRHTIEAFLAHSAIDRLVVALHPDDRELFAQAVPERNARVILVDGGPSRQSSTRLALRALGERPPDFVLVHDGVRPFVDAELIARVVDGLSSEAGSLPSLAVSDTLKAIDHRGMVGSTVPRDGLYAAQTPQGFPYRLLHDAHERAAAAGHDHFTDDSAIAEWAGIAVRIVQGSPDNVKITWARDIHLADIRMKAQSMHFPDIRTGNGYDVHAFEDGEAVVLCGVSIPHTHKLSGHSDADVGLHALTDALLATCAAGDIGTHFPPSDPQWKGAASRLFVEHAAGLVRQRGGRIANADVTLICEAPRIGPHREAMTTALAQMLSISHDRISIKATTNEKLGFVGRREGIAAIATATVIFPGDVPE